MLSHNRLNQLGKVWDLIRQLLSQAQHHGLALLALVTHFEKVPDLKAGRCQKSWHSWSMLLFASRQSQRMDWNLRPAKATHYAWKTDRQDLRMIGSFHTFPSTKLTRTLCPAYARSTTMASAFAEKTLLPCRSEKQQLRCARNHKILL